MPNAISGLAGNMTSVIRKLENIQDKRRFTKYKVTVMDGATARTKVVPPVASGADRIRNALQRAVFGARYEVVGAPQQQKTSAVSSAPRKPVATDYFSYESYEKIGTPNIFFADSSKDIFKTLNFYKAKLDSSENISVRVREQRLAGIETCIKCLSDAKAIAVQYIEDNKDNRKENPSVLQGVDLTLIISFLTQSINAAEDLKEKI